MHVSRSRVLLLVAVAGLAAALILGAVLAPRPAGATDAVAKSANRVRRVMVATELRRTLADIHAARDRAWRWDDVMSAPRSPYDASAERSSSLHYRRMLLGVWTVRAEQAQRIARHPPLLRDWLCIHRYEAAWNDPDAPYYGGLQMDMSFMQAYGGGLLRRKGTADHWTPLEQIWVAERAYRSGLGFYPWPTTARWCGLT